MPEKTFIESNHKSDLFWYFKRFIFKFFPLKYVEIIVFSNRRHSINQFH